MTQFLYTTLFIFCFINQAFCQLVINEFLASNQSNYIESDFGTFPDWIEIYNAGEQPIDISGYFLTNDLQYPKKWQIPKLNKFIKPKSFLLFMADGKDQTPGNVVELIDYSLPGPGINNIYIKNPHLNFRLKKEGGVIGLFNANGTLLDSISYDKQLTDVSYGRQPDGDHGKYFFGEPTPGKSNKTDATSHNSSIAQAPLFSTPGGFFDERLELTINSNSKGAIIRYSLDGSIPTSRSRKYNGAIKIDTTTVVRARTFEKGFLPGKTITQTYLINENISLPVISISTDPENLWDDMVGIYVVGTNGIPRYLEDKANYNQDWERPISFEYYSGERKINMSAGIKIVGLMNQWLPQKSLAIHARQKYEGNDIHFKFFKEKEIDHFKSILLRNSSADWESVHFRDGLLPNIIQGEMDIDYQAYRPVIVFINGEYWGIQNLREKINEHYPASNFGVNPDSIDLLETLEKVIITNGDSKHYDSLINFIKTHNIKKKEVYDHITKQIDIDEFINYNIAEIYCANYDWPGNNSRFWRPKTKNGKWRWVIVDTEAGFGLADSGNYKHNTLHRAATTTGDPNGWNAPWATLLLSSLLENSEFRNEFISKMEKYLNTSFDPDRVIGIIDSMKSTLEPEMARHIDKWKNIDSANEWDYIESMKVWEENIEVLREFARKRPYYLRKYMMNEFDLNGMVELKITTSSTCDGKVLIDKKSVKNKFKGIYFLQKEKTLPINLQALPCDGYKFVKWKGVKINNTKSDITIQLKKDSKITAIFKKDDQPDK